MKKTILYCALTLTLAVLICTGAQAATINTTLTVNNASGPFSGSAATLTGQANLTNIGSGSFAATLSLTGASPFTITLAPSGDKISGTLSVTVASLATGTGAGTATVTGGTGAYAGATGSFPSLTGTGSLGFTGTATLSFSGSGTINTGGGGGVVGPPVPLITDVLDAGSYSKNIAQGSIFVVKGTNLSPSGDYYTPLSFPFPTSSSGVKITFTPSTGGAGTDAYLLYLFNRGGVNQLAAVLPSTLAVGNYTVAVTNGTASAGFPVQVVQRKIGLITADGSGSGMALMQNYISDRQLDVDRFTTYSAGGFTFSPAKPGQVLIAWGTGMGPVTGGDNVGSAGFNFAANGVNVQVIVGGVSITPAYAGRAPGLAGADQINFQLPANVPTGCTVSLQVSVNGVLSNSTFIAIAPDGNAAACVQPGFTTEQLQRYDRDGASYTGGSFSLSQISLSDPSLGTFKSNSASGAFTRFTGFQLAALAQYQAQVTRSGACTVIHYVSSGQQSAAPTATGTGLDAGSVTLSGPSGSNLSNTPFTQDAKTLAYSINLGIEGAGISLPGSVNASLIAGTYTVNGAGGRDVGRFNASVSIGSPLTLSPPSLPSVVNRSAGLTLNWNGGNSDDLVEIVGSTSTVTGPSANRISDTWTFICTTNAGARTFTVPPSILTQLPAVAASAITAGTGSSLLEVVSGVVANFSAPLVAGGNIDGGAFLSLVGIGALPSYQ